ncbi:MAG TPA: phage major capsid protein [Gemmatimonadota bacterium]|nr:phage major capsid protein [Gemmatimonadota bacterium]
MDPKDLNSLRTVDELVSYKSECVARRQELDEEFRGIPFTDDARGEFKTLTETIEEIESRVSELEFRTKIVQEYAGDERKTEPEFRFSSRKPSTPSGDDIYDLSTIRVGFDNPAAAVGEFHDRAMRSIEQSKFPAKDAKEKVAGLLEQDNDGALALRMLKTGSPVYKRAFGKLLANKPRTAEEERALTISGDGFAVPYVVDPTVVLTSDGVINPVRQLARVIQITGNHWTGVATAGVSASYDGEGVEVSDDTPDLTQPTADVEKAQAYIEYSIELGEDWGALQSEMARMFADAKDTLESNKFLHGLGHASTEPEGLLVGATGTVLTANSTTLAVADLYSLVAGLAPRWRARAAFAGDLATYQSIRQFDQNGGADLWVQLRFGEPGTLLGRPALEWSDFAAGVASGTSVLTFGDFGEFTIVDRIGMNVEVVPHVFATANNRPSGKRGLYAHWRNTSDVRTAAAFKTLKVK